MTSYVSMPTTQAVLNLRHVFINDQYIVVVQSVTINPTDGTTKTEETSPTLEELTKFEDMLISQHTKNLAIIRATKRSLQEQEVLIVEPTWKSIKPSENETD